MRSEQRDGDETNPRRFQAYEINLVVGVDDRSGATIWQHFRTRSRVQCR
jgi:hypothetical protein